MQLEAARSKITNAIIGIVITFSIWGIATLIGWLFNVPFLIFGGIPVAPPPAPTSTPAPVPPTSVPGCGTFCGTNNSICTPYGLVCDSGASGDCRRAACLSEPSCICPPTPTSPPRPAGCNKTPCPVAGCPNGLICFQNSCRNANCTSDSTCVCPGITASPTPRPTRTPTPTNTPRPTRTPVPITPYAYRVILNEASFDSCDTLCSQLGPGYSCNLVGTDAAGTNSRKSQSIGGQCIDVISSCGEIIEAWGLCSNGLQSEWTNCSCLVP